MLAENQNDRSFISNGEVDTQLREIIQLIRKLVRARELYTKELIKKYQLSASQLHCILVLNEMGPLPPSKIAQHIMVNSSTVTGVIDRLEKKGFLERMRNSKDRRVITIALTEKGKELANNAPLPVQERMIKGIRALTEKERDQIIQALRTLTEMVDTQKSNLSRQPVTAPIM
jgi:DNA-binding MarR family transcriptional regulator